MTLFRELITLVESSDSQPSKEFLEATARWVRGFYRVERGATEQKLLAHRSEALSFTNYRYSVLYRGQSITDEQQNDVENGRNIEIDMARLTSWTTSRSVAKDYAEGAYGAAILIRKNSLDVFLDIRRVLPLLREHQEALGLSNEELRYASRESEVICEISTPLIVTSKNIVARLF